MPTPLAELTYTHDAAGNLTSTIDGSTVATGTGGTLADAYDPLGRLQQVKQTLGGSVNERVNFTYNDDSSLNQVKRYADDGSTLVVTGTYDHDRLGRLTGLNYTSGNFSPFSSSSAPGYTFGYDLASNMTSMTSAIDNATGTSTTYSNDASGRLTSATYNSSGNTISGYGAVNEAYTLDANGNRVAATSTTSSTQAAWGTGAANRLLWDGTYSYTYDKEGNRLTKTAGTSGATVRYSYDYRNPTGQAGQLRQSGRRPKPDQRYADGCVHV